MVTTTIQIFPDNTKIYHAIQDRDDQIILQRDLDVLEVMVNKEAAALQT